MVVILDVWSDRLIYVIHGVVVLGVMVDKCEAIVDTTGLTDSDIFGSPNGDSNRQPLGQQAAAKEKGKAPRLLPFLSYRKLRKMKN